MTPPREAADRLRAMIGHARNAEEELARLTAEGRALAEADSRHRTELDERLRVGARMLQALQGQIDRTAVLAETLERQANALDTVRRRVDADLARASARVDDAARVLVADAEARVQAVLDTGVARLDAEINTRLDRLASLGRDRIDAAEADLVARIDGAVAQASSDFDVKLAAADAGTERVHERMAELELGLEGLETQMRDVKADTEAGAEHAAEVAATLTRAAHGLDARLETARTDGERLAGQSAAAAARVEERERGLADAMERGRALATRLERSAEMLPRLQEAATGLEELLARLDPWERLLMPGERSADGTPRALAELVANVKQGLGADLGELARTLRSVAAQVDDAAPEPETHDAPVPPVVVKPFRIGG